VGDLRLDVTRHEVSVAGRPVQLTPREFEVLKSSWARPAAS